MNKNNTIKLDNYLTRAIEELKKENHAGRFDVNTRWEETARKILNTAYGWNLQRLQTTEKKNYPGIDLGDRDRMIGVQVSSQNTTTKINDMLSKLNNEVDGTRVSTLYKNAYLFVIGYRLKKYDERKFTIPDNITFDILHILDFNSLKEQFIKLDDVHQNKILDILETDIVKHPKYELNSNLINFGDFVPNSRKKEMTQIDEAFRRSKNVFLWGLGGIGKSELAVEWAKEKKAQGESVYVVHYRDSIIDTVCNLEFSNYEYNEEEYENEVERKSDAERRAAQFREKLDILREYYSDAVIIIDNFDKESPEVSWTDMLGQKGYSDLVGLKTRFLFTTRFEVKTSAIYVPEMNLEDLLVLFKQNARKTLSAEEEQKAIELIELVDRHTLTVDLMSRSLYLSYGEINIESLIKAFRENELGNRPLPYIEAHHNSKNSDFEYRESRVLGHLKILFEMSSLNKVQLDVMIHALLLPESGIDIRLFHQSQTDAENEVLTQSLLRRRWLRINQEHTHLSMHPVIRQVCNAELEPTDDNCSFFVNSLIEIVKPIKSQYDSKAAYDTIIQAANILEDRTGRWHFVSGKHYRFIGCYEIAKGYLESAIKLADLNDPNATEELVMMLHETALINNRLKDYDHAIELYLNALDLLQNPDDKSDKSLFARIYHDLGTSYGYLAEEKRDPELFKISLEYLNKSLDINRANPLSSNPLYISHSIHTIGNISAKMGKTLAGSDQKRFYKQALENHLEALRIRSDIFGAASYNINIARSYNAIGNDYANLKDDEKALDYRRKALDYCENILLNNHPDIAKAHSNIAHSYQQLKNYPCAIDHYKKAEAIYKANLPQERKNYAKCKYRLLQVYLEKSRYTQIDDLQIARKYGEEALDLAHDLNDDYLLSDVNSLLSEIYGKLGDKKKKQELLVSRMNISVSKSKRFKDNQYRNLADAAWKNGDIPTAEKYYKELYDYQKEYTPEDHNNLAETLHRLGLIYQNMKCFDLSICCLEKAIEHFQLTDVLSEKVKQAKIKTINKTIMMVFNSKKKSLKKC